MSFIDSLDRSLFVFVNQTLSHPVLDRVMPWLSWNPVFFPILAVVVGWMIAKRGTRGRLFAVMLGLVLVVSDAAVINPLRKSVQRPRPYVSMPEAKTLGGRTSSFSFPSSHTANWFAAAVVTACYWRRLGLLVGLGAMAVGFSRIYNGMHYPGDVMGGAILGSGVAGLGLCLGQWVWRTWGARMFPEWHRAVPSILDPPDKTESAVGGGGDGGRFRTDLYTRLAYLFIGVLLLVRWGYLAMGRIELSEDEAYQWLWSKHLALSYYSKPPMIAYAQWVGTSLFGDTELGVRFLSPLLGAGLSVLVFRFMRSMVSPRAGWWVVLATAAMPLLGVGSVLLTIDPLSVFFWVGAMIAGWSLVNRPETSMRSWVLMGLCWAGGFLSKYTALFQLVCWGLFCVLHPPARRTLRDRGLLVALGILVLSTVPVLVWNAAHGWITVIHLQARAGLNETWKPTLRFLGDFVGGELALLNPVFLVMMLVAGWAAWKERRKDTFGLYLFCMGFPIFLGYWLYTLRARVQPNWIAPAVLPMVCLAVARLEPRWETVSRGVRRVIVGGFVFGLVAVVLLHETRLVSKIIGRPLPEGLDPLNRVRGWKELSRVVEEERVRLAAEGKPVLVIGGHYGTTSLLTFYTPEARRRAGSDPYIFFPVGDHPVNQFYFWEGYKKRAGVNAIFVQKVDSPEPAAEIILKQFETVTDLGMRAAVVRGQVVRRVQLFACRGLREGLE